MRTFIASAVLFISVLATTSVAFSFLSDWTMRAHVVEDGTEVLETVSLEDCTAGLPEGFFDYECRKRNEQKILEAHMTAPNTLDSSKILAEAFWGYAIAWCGAGIVAFLLVIGFFSYFVHSPIQMTLCGLACVPFFLIGKIPFSVIIGFALAILGVLALRRKSNRKSN